MQIIEVTPVEPHVVKGVKETLTPSLDVQGWPNAIAASPDEAIGKRIKAIVENRDGSRQEIVFKIDSVNGCTLYGSPLLHYDIDVRGGYLKETAFDPNDLA